MGGVEPGPSGRAPSRFASRRGGRLFLSGCSPASSPAGPSSPYFRE
ncbi:hypothetical protein HMPREF0063_11203 [Aeromicrobium marinum DSM 15272]|uniref:Uncharacterized protein n=1 Tax=Aeromicrobium marinum DSM 15272 TaxID=585531 RepID=E2SAZ4_9ACTN|nr:hypothetical protein HMPREF0063_11203 [Aeromicrobium marinum DSM 15272]